MPNITIEKNPKITQQTSQKVPNDKISYEKFLEWNGEESWFEWVDGEVFEMSNPSLTHQRLVRFLTTILQHWVEEKKIGEVIPSPFQIKLDSHPSGRQPDIIFISNENMHRLKKQYVEGTTDLIIEIILPESVARDTTDKFLEYEKAGVKEYWLIDPKTRTANFYGFDDDGKYKLLHLAVEGKFESLVIEGLWIKTDWLWQEELPNLLDILKEWEMV